MTERLRLRFWIFAVAPVLVIVLLLGWLALAPGKRPKSHAAPVDPEETTLVERLPPPTHVSPAPTQTAAPTQLAQPAPLLNPSAYAPAASASSPEPIPELDAFMWYPQDSDS